MSENPLADSPPTPAATGTATTPPVIDVGVLHNALLKSASISVIATDQNGVIQLFNSGAERMLGYIATDVINKTTVVAYGISQKPRVPAP